MELETLEVLLDINTERVMQSLEKVLPQIENAMSRIERMSGSSMDKTEKHMDIDKGASNFTKQLEKMNQTLEKTMANFEKSTKQTSEAVGANLATGVRKARPKVTKEIDAMVNEINAKMGQAKAAQEKVAYLKSQRQSASSKGDTGQVVKYDEQIARAQSQMTKFQDQAKGLGNTIKRELDSVPSSLDNITKGMSRNEAQIEQMRKRIRTLKAEYNDQRVPRGSFSSGFKNYEDTPQSLKTSSEIQKQSVKMDKLISDNDRLQKEYAQTEDRAEMLRKALLRVNNALGQSSIQTGSAVNGANMTGSGLKQSERAVSRYGGVFNRMSNAIAHGAGNVGNGLRNSLGFIGKFGSLFSSTSNRVTRGTAQMTQGTGAFGQSMKYLLPSLIVYQLIGGAISKMASGMMSALKTNDEFASSLNQIKVNLLTAFYPIYTAILPAINAFMSGLAQLTGQLASFIAMIFGTTYQAAKQGASGLYDNVQALNETGSSASKAHEKVKKLQKSLMGFDEINNLTVSTNDDKLDSDAGKTPGVDFGSATGSYSTPKWMTDIQKILKDFFKPFQDAWKNQGRKVIDAWKYALSEVIGLAQSIGRSFMEVWTNGTGQLFIENILKLLSMVLNIIGDIARAFKNAWNDNNRGTKLIQSIFDLWNRILELLYAVGDAFREAWNDGTGERIAGNILEILTNIFKSLSNIAESWKKIFKGSTGKSIINGLLDIVDILLEKINNISKIFEKWTRNLNFEPLAKSFDRLIKAIKPLAGNIGDALAWFLENVLLPVGTYVIEDALPFFFETLSSVLEALSNVINRLKPFISWFFDKLIKPIVNFTLSATSQWLKFLGRFRDALVGLLNLDTSGFKSIVSDFQKFGSDIWEGLKNGLSKIKQQAAQFVKEKMVDPVVNWFKKLLGINSPSKLFTSFGEFIIQGLFNGIRNLMAKPAELISKIWTGMKSTVTGKTSEIFGSSKKWWGDTKKTVSDVATSTGKWVSDKWQGISRTTSNTWGNVSKWSSEKWNSAKKSVTDNAKSIWDNTKNRWSDIGKNTRKTWDDFTNKITDTTRRAKDNGSNRINDLKNNLRNRFGETWSSARSNFDNIFAKITNQSNNANSRGSKAFRNMRNNMAISLSGLQSTSKGVFDKIGSWASNLPNRIATGLRNGVQAIKNAASSIGNGMVGIIGKAMNGVISGINWVLGKVGAGKSKLGSWKIPKYATGTGYHPGGLAMVNDGTGSNYQEAFRTPDGHTGLFPKQRNMVVNLPKGSSVLSGSKTAKMMKRMPAYANGIGDWFKEKWNQTKEIASDVWSYAKNPSKLLNAAVSKFVNLSNILQPSLDMAKGTVATVASGATKWVTDKFKVGHEKHKAEQEASNIGHDGSIDKGWGVFSYLRTIADKTIAKFGNGLRITSGQRDGDPYYHGRRQAVDIALPANMNGSNLNKQIANWVFDTYQKQVAYVITNGQVRDRSGFSGTGNSGNWVRWPDNDHYDHVHVNGLLSSKDIVSTTSKAFKSVRGSSAGSVARTIWNGLRANSYSKQAAAGILGNVEAESSMNPDLDELYGPGYGIVQWTSPYRAESGRSYVQRLMKRAGIRGDYRSAEAQTKLLLWHMRNGQWIGQVDPRSIAAFKKTTSVPKATYAFLKNFERAGIERIDRRYAAANKWYKNLAGYENGGLVTQDGIYRMGEGNKKEMVIPLERPQRAAELIQQAIEYLGLDMFGSSITLPEMFQQPTFTPSNNTFSNNEQMNYQGGGMQQSFETIINGIMMAITSIGGQPQRASNGDIIINLGGRELARITIEEINKYHRQLGYNTLEI